MTPVLFGRWQTRLFLLGVVGSLVTLLFALAQGSFTPFLILAFVTFTGFFWDIIYSFIQKFHWDRDWPAMLQFLAGVWEFIILALIVYRFQLFGPPGNPLILFFHYWAVWLTTFICSQSIMRIIFPRWRFYGGRII
ncbi:MAG: hypothetical protein ACI9EW_001888 [Cellvibrionaceae bacterium]|jgi:hypothetical protein